VSDVSLHQTFHRLWDRAIAHDPGYDTAKPDWIEVDCALHDAEEEATKWKMAAQKLSQPAPGPCTLAPAGWRCTRAAGHEPPCAAVPLTGHPFAATDAPLFADEPVTPVVAKDEWTWCIPVCTYLLGMAMGVTMTLWIFQ
jgi:hypothetical protein